jgi:hypothetical protein
MASNEWKIKIMNCKDLVRACRDLVEVLSRRLLGGNKKYQEKPLSK